MNLEDISFVAERVESSYRDNGTDTEREKEKGARWGTKTRWKGRENPNQKDCNVNDNLSFREATEYSQRAFGISADEADYAVRKVGCSPKTLGLAYFIRNGDFTKAIDLIHTHKVLTDDFDKFDRLSKLSEEYRVDSARVTDIYHILSDKLKGRVEDVLKHHQKTGTSLVRIQFTLQNYFQNHKYDYDTSEATEVKDDATVYRLSDLTPEQIEVVWDKLNGEVHRTLDDKDLPEVVRESPMDEDSTDALIDHLNN